MVVGRFGSGAAGAVNGREMAEGNDGSGRETGGMDVGSGKDAGWKAVQRADMRRKRKEQSQQTEILYSEETDNAQSARASGGQSEEHKVMLKLVQEGALFSEWNPVHLITAINKWVGGDLGQKSVAQWVIVDILQGHCSSR